MGAKSITRGIGIVMARDPLTTSGRPMLKFSNSSTNAVMAAERADRSTSKK